MFKVLRKSPIKLSDFSNSKDVQILGINPRFIRTVLDFDGSMTKFVMNLSSGSNKPLVKIIEEKQITFQSIKSSSQQNSIERDTLVKLQNIFSQSKQTNTNLIQRSISFNLIDSKQTKKQKLLYFARSFWNEQKYIEIMQKNKHKPIGLNLIDQKIQLFRQINWTGVCDLEIAQNNQAKQQTKIYKNLFSRSYTMLNHGQPLCQLQQFFLPQMFDIFVK